MPWRMAVRKYLSITSSKLSQTWCLNNSCIFKRSTSFFYFILWQWFLCKNIRLKFQLQLWNLAKLAVIFKTKILTCTLHNHSVTDVVIWNNSILNNRENNVTFLIKGIGDFQSKLTMEESHCYKLLTAQSVQPPGGSLKYSGATHPR